MIPVKRLPEPEALRRNKESWLATFLEQRTKEPGKRPRHAQYAHPQVIATLQAMSHNKCFYCEQKQARCEVDHYIDVAERPELAFEWTNLYLSCWECNHHKQPHRAIPVSDCLDPCDVDVRPAEHLDFDDENITARGGSQRGFCTIKKYRLDSEELDLKRLRQLKLLLKVVIEVREKMTAEGRKVMTEPEKALLRHFAQPDYPFSLMFSIYLARHGYL